MTSPLDQQWDCIRQNIGTWHGSFTQFSPAGELVKDTPSVLTLEETEPDETMELTLKRFPPDAVEQINQLTFKAPGPAPYTYFFKSGTFAQGSSQWSSFGRFGTEVSLKVGDKRVRFVIMYEGTSRYTSEIKYVTLIGETQENGTTFAEARLSTDQIQGNWRGMTEVINAIDQTFTTGESEWTFSQEQLSCSEQSDGERKEVALSVDTSTDGLIQLAATDDSSLAYQIMLLPKGAYCLLPQEIKQESAFRIEVGWVSEAKVRSRLIRYYDTRGVWTSSALITDQRTKES